jgi:mRNA interferase MazF
MRAIHLVRLDKPRPAVVLTRERAVPSLRQITVAPITSTIWGLSSEVSVGTANGLDHESVISCDNMTSIDKSQLGKHLGFLLPDQEIDLTRALHLAFDLSDL